MNTDLRKFLCTLPYDSQMYGIYQPLVGWRSRIQNGRLPEQSDGPPEIADDIVPNGQDGREAIVALGNIDLFAVRPDRNPFTVSSTLESVIVFKLQQTCREFLEAGNPREDLEFWRGHFRDELQKARLQFYYGEAVKLIADFASKIPIPDSDRFPNHAIVAYFSRLATRLGNDSYNAWLGYALNREVYVSRYLASLTVKPVQTLQKLLMTQTPEPNILDVLQSLDPAALDVQDFRDATLTPIGLIHLYRQYFFEFDSFLGPPVEHIWLSPGSTTELVESSTRRALVERSIEQFSETIMRSEFSATEQDEISKAVKAENQSDVKLASSATAGANILVFSASATANASYEQTEKSAREETHRLMRQQSSKLSGEIRNNFKSTFRTVTETTDVRSKRIVIANNQPDAKLVNYELRRKMRQVGIQLQDVGTRLCWQIYIDDPGKDLGVARLVHLSSRADLSAYPTLPLLPTPPENVTRVVNLDVYVPNEGDQRSLTMDVVVGAVGLAAGGVPTAVVAVTAYEVLDHFFGGGQEKGNSYGIGTKTSIRQPFKVALPEGYELTEGLAPDPQDPGFVLSMDGSAPGDYPIRKLNGGDDKTFARCKVLSAREGLCEIVVYAGTVQPSELLEFKVKIGLQVTIDHKNNVSAMNAATIEKNKQHSFEAQRAIKDELVKGVQERVKQASEIRPRPANELREEERTVVYRVLITKLMDEVWQCSPSGNLAHLRSEIVKTLFDVDSLMYYVAPEWWQPRKTGSRLDLSFDRDTRPVEPSVPVGTRLKPVKRPSNPPPVTPDYATLGARDSTAWGGEDRRDSYFITEDSTPARLGSSLGWLIQLDGDNLRNAFLNAPWVKAVIPIRPGRETDALNWLLQAEVEGSEGLDEVVQREPVEVSKRDLLFQIAKALSQKHQLSKELVEETVDLDSGENRSFTFLPGDQVFEKGFDPLKGGVKLEPDKPFEVFDQWVEVLPTDQIVAVEVEYDPITGNQRPPSAPA